MVALFVAASQDGRRLQMASRRHKLGNHAECIHAKLLGALNDGCQGVI